MRKPAKYGTLTESERKFERELQAWTLPESIVNLPKGKCRASLCELAEACGAPRVAILVVNMEQFCIPGKMHGMKSKLC